MSVALRVHLSRWNISKLHSTTACLNSSLKFSPFFHLTFHMHAVSVPLSPMQFQPNLFLRLITCIIPPLPPRFFQRKRRIKEQLPFFSSFSWGNYYFECQLYHRPFISTCFSPSLQAMENSPLQGYRDTKMTSFERNSFYFESQLEWTIWIREVRRNSKVTFAVPLLRRHLNAGYCVVHAI
jgi:hypothetical protein